MRLTEFKGEEALDLIADLIGPISKMYADKEMVKISKKGDRVEAVKYAIKTHKSEIIEILARLNKQEPEEYECNVFTLLQDCMEVVNDKELLQVFQTVGKKGSKTVSTLPTENIKGKKN